MSKKSSGRSFTHFRRLLENNNQALAAMADLEEKLTGDFLFDTGYLYNQVENLSGRVGEMIEALNALSQDRYSELKLVYQRPAGRYPAGTGGGAGNTADTLHILPGSAP